MRVSYDIRSFGRLPLLDTVTAIYQIAKAWAAALTVEMRLSHSIISYLSAFGQHLFQTPVDVFQPVVRLDHCNNSGLELSSGSFGAVKGIHPIVIEKPTEAYFSPGIRFLFSQEVSQQSATFPVALESNISYLPDEEAYRARVLRNQQRGSLEQDVPLGWPLSMQGPLLWEAKELTEDDYLYHLTPADLLEIDVALGYFKGW